MGPEDWSVRRCRLYSVDLASRSEHCQTTRVGLLVDTAEGTWKAEGRLSPGMYLEHPGKKLISSMEMQMKQRYLVGFALVASASLALACKPRKDASSAAADTEGGVVTLGGKTCEVVEMIEDCENADNQIIKSGNRNGYIYTFADKEGSTVTPQSGELGGTFTMTEGGANGSGYAARMMGTIATAAVTYAGMGFNITDPKAQFDASQYDGLAYFIRKAPGTTARVRLKVPDVNTDPDGGVCQECFNDFGADMSVDDEWKQWMIPWSAMTQMQGWGNPRPPAIDSKTITSIQFQTQDKGQKFDVWVDDLAFIKCQ